MRPRTDGYKPAAPFEMIMKYLGLAMAVVYVVIGVAIVWRADEMFRLPSNYSLPLGCLLIIYGLFRGYGVYRKYFK